MAGKTGKNDAADAIAICEAAAAAYALCTSQRRKPAGNAMLTSDKTGFIQERTATYNRLRGLISEFGVAPQSTDALRHVVSDQKETLPVQVRLH
jgi:transposase